MLIKSLPLTSIAPPSSTTGFITSLPKEYSKLSLLLQVHAYQVGSFIFGPSIKIKFSAFFIAIIHY
jgi:hypothetical protein